MRRVDGRTALVFLLLFDYKFLCFPQQRLESLRKRGTLWNSRRGRTGLVWFGFSEEETHGKDMFGKIRNARFGATSVEWWPPCGA